MYGTSLSANNYEIGILSCRYGTEENLHDQCVFLCSFHRLTKKIKELLNIKYSPPPTSISSPSQKGDLEETHCTRPWQTL